MITGTDFLMNPYDWKWEEIQELKAFCVKFFKQYRSAKGKFFDIKPVPFYDNSKIIKAVERQHPLHALNIFYKQIFDRIRIMEDERKNIGEV